VKSLARAIKEETGQGHFLPTVLRPLDEMKMKTRLGTATFVAGPPGAYKTGFMLYMVLRWNLPTLYFSADSEPFEMFERAAAAITGDTMEEVRHHPADYVDDLQVASNVRFVYEDAPTYSDVELEVAAYAEVYGVFPQIIVIDNLMNLTGESEDEWSSHRDHARVIHRLTRITKAALFVLAHMSDDRPDPSRPAPRSKLMGKVGALPKAIWSLALKDNQLLIAPVKNRWGPGDASGSTYATVFVDPARSRLYNSYHDMQRGVPA
jgi:hypothetical protein